MLLKTISYELMVHLVEIQGMENGIIMTLQRNAMDIPLYLRLFGSHCWRTIILFIFYFL